MVENLPLENKIKIYNPLYNRPGQIYQYIRERSSKDSPIYSKDIQKKFNIGKSTVSRHLKILSKAGLIHIKREGREKGIFIE